MTAPMTAPMPSQPNEVWVAVTPRDVVVVEGPEAQSYLHGQVSADVEVLEVGASTMTMLLEPRGRIESVFHMTRTAEEKFVLDVETGFGEPTCASLERFKLRTKAEFTQLAATAISLRSASTEALELARTDVGRMCATTSMSEASALPGPFVERPAGWPQLHGVELLVDAQSRNASDFREMCFEFLVHVTYSWAA